MRRSVPFTVTRIIDRGTASTATPAAGVCASIFGAAVAIASAAPVPFRNFRLEILFFGLDLLMEDYCSAVGARLTRILDIKYAYLTITALARSIWAAVRSSVFATTTICSL